MKNEKKGKGELRLGGEEGREGERRVRVERKGESAIRAQLGKGMEKGRRWSRKEKWRG